MDTSKHDRRSTSFLQTTLNRLALVLVAVALLLTAFCLGIQQLPAAGGSARMAGRWLVPPHLRADWEWATSTIHDSGLSNGELADHVILAGLQRRWFFTTAEDEVFRRHVLNPFISDAGEDTGWRRPLWEALWQLVRKQPSRVEAARKIRRLLYERVTVTARAQGGIIAAWEARQTDRREFEQLTVAALRSVGIPSRLDNDGRAEWLDGAKWQRFAEIDEVHEVLTIP